MSQHYPPGHFGPNHAGVAEVFDFALSDACFGPQAPPGRLPPGVLIVRSLPGPNADPDIEVEGDLKIRVPLVGRTVERVIVDDLRAYIADEVAGAAGWEG